MEFLLPSLEEESSNSTIIITTEKRIFMKPSSTRLNPIKVGMPITLTSKSAMMDLFIMAEPVGSASGQFPVEWLKFPPTERLPRSSGPGFAYRMGSENFRMVGLLWGITRGLMCRPARFPSPVRTLFTGLGPGINTAINMIPKRSSSRSFTCPRSSTVQAEDSYGLRRIKDWVR